MVESTDAAGEMRGIETEMLDDGIRLEVFDGSRPLVGDRWQVAAVVRLVIPVDAVLAAGASDEPDPSEISALTGDPVVFEKRLERTFVSADQKKEILQEMVRGYLDGARAYLSRPAFARNYILKRYAEAVRKARWYADHGEGSWPTPEAAKV